MREVRSAWDKTMTPLLLSSWPEEGRRTGLDIAREGRERPPAKSPPGDGGWAFPTPTGESILRKGKPSLIIRVF